MKLSDLISRTDVEALQDILGKTTINLINKIEQVLLGMYSQTDLITNKRIKNILFDLLKEEEVRAILNLLAKNIENDIWE